MFVLPQLKKDLDFNKSLRSLVEILKSIAVSHYHHLERQIKNEEAFFSVLEGFFDFPELKNARHPFVLKSQRPLGIAAVTSDMGLLGGLNMKVMAAAFEDQEKYNSRLIVIGEKGHALARDRKLSFVAFPGVDDSQRFSQSAGLADFFIEQVMTGKLGAVEVIYPEPLNFLVQRIKKIVLLPFSVPENKSERAVTPAGSILESLPVDVIEYLVSLWMTQMFYQVLGFSRLAELSARFVHLESSSQKLQEVEKQLKLRFFRVRHELIDKSMREVYCARLVYAQAM